jgi:preprotein translocase subunit SecG
MTTALLVIHILLAFALIGIVLLQRSEGGGLGIGGGMSGLMTGRSSANLLTRLTAGLAGLFFTTSLVLAILASHPSRPGSIFDTGAPEPAPATTAPAAPSNGQPAPAPAAPAPAAPAAPAPQTGTSSGAPAVPQGQ